MHFAALSPFSGRRCNPNAPRNSICVFPLEMCFPFIDLRGSVHYLCPQGGAPNSWSHNLDPLLHCLAQGMKLDKFGFFKSYKAENKEREDIKPVTHSTCEPVRRSMCRKVPDLPWKLLPHVVSFDPHKAVYYGPTTNQGRSFWDVQGLPCASSWASVTERDLLSRKGSGFSGREWWFMEIYQWFDGDLKW